VGIVAVGRAVSTEVVPGGVAVHHPVRAALREIALLGTLMVAYSRIRLAAGDDLDTAVGHARGVLRIERVLHLDVESAMNAGLHALPALEVAASYWYAALHYTVTPIALVLLYRHRPQDYRRARTALVLATTVALVCYVTLPTAPPRLVGGYTDVLLRTSHVGWWGAEGSAVRGAGGAVDQFAAMPSMHVGWALWSGLVFWRLSRSGRQRALAAAYPLGTTAVVLATANHWLLDALAGALLVATAWLVTMRRRHADPGAPGRTGVRLRESIPGWLGACTAGGTARRSPTGPPARGSVPATRRRPPPARRPRRRTRGRAPGGRAAPGADGTAGCTTRPTPPAPGRACSWSGGSGTTAGTAGSPTPSTGTGVRCWSRPGCPPRSSSRADRPERIGDRSVWTSGDPDTAGAGARSNRAGERRTHMTSAHDEPTLDDVIIPEEPVVRDRTEHAKDPHLSDEVLEHRTELERQAVGSDDAAPEGAFEHDATES
jgi:PAP2 superfamily